MSNIDAIFLFFLLLLPILILITRKFNKKQHSKNVPPSPPKLPYIGNLHQLGTLPHQSLWRLSKKYGHVMLLRLGSVPTVIVSSPEAAKAVMKAHDLDSCSRPPLCGAGLLTYNYLDLAFTPYGEYWREMRKICVLELFSVKRVQSYRSIREEELAKLINSISVSGSPVDLTEKFFALTASIIFRIALGTRFQGSNFNHCRFNEVIEAAEATLASFCAAEYFPYVGWIVDRLTGLQHKTERIAQELDSFFQMVIDDHLSPSREKQDHEDVVDVLLKIVKERAGFGAASLTETNIKAVLLNIFLGGVDTGAITMVWAMAELAKRPSLMNKAQHEVRSCFVNKRNSIITESDIEQLHYVKMIVKETLRLHPPAPLLIPRETISQFKLGGYDVAPKTQLQVNVWAIGRDPEYWKDPEEFIPERFMDSPIDFKGQHFEFLPFGSGRRMCPAVYMGATTVELGLANMLYAFDWKLPDGMKEEDLDMEESAGHSITLSKRTALKLVPKTPTMHL